MSLNWPQTYRKRNIKYFRVVIRLNIDDTVKTCWIFFNMTSSDSLSASLLAVGCFRNTLEKRLQINPDIVAQSKIFETQNFQSIYVEKSAAIWISSCNCWPSRPKHARIVLFVLRLAQNWEPVQELHLDLPSTDLGLELGKCKLFFHVISNVLVCGCTAGLCTNNCENEYDQKTDNCVRKCIYSLLPTILLEAVNTKELCEHSFIVCEIFYMRTNFVNSDLKVLRPERYFTKNLLLNIPNRFLVSNFLFNDLGLFRTAFFCPDSACEVIKL